MISSDGAVDESKCVIEPENNLKVWGQKEITMPDGIVRSVAGFGEMLGWKPRLLDLMLSRL